MNQDLDVLEDIIAIRRDIHQHPELAFQEFRTSELVIKSLKEYGFTEVYSLAGTGVVGVLKGEIDEFILLRADMDALPLQEQPNLPYKSQVPNVMHACGHDAHTAMLLVAARQTIRLVDQGTLRLRRGIKFCFQPAEEKGGGAKAIIKDTSVYDLMASVVNCFGQHVNTKFSANQIRYSPGPCKAHCDFWEVIVKGSGGHAMAPEDTKDALQIGVQLVNSIYQIKSRNLDQTSPSTISIGKFKSGQAPNIINGTAVIAGNIRTLHLPERQTIMHRLAQLCKGAELQHDCTVTLTYTDYAPAVINSPDIAAYVQAALKQCGNLLPCEFDLGAEDFSEFSNLRPSAYIILGAAPADSDETHQYPNHGPNFQIDESVLLTGLKIWTQLIDQFCSKI